LRSALNDTTTRLSGWSMSMGACSIPSRSAWCSRDRPATPGSSRGWKASRARTRAGPLLWHPMLGETLETFGRENNCEIEETGCEQE